MKNVQLILLILPMFLLTSCFEIMEEVNVNQNGSGHAKLTANLSQSKTNIANFLDIGEYNGIKLPQKSDIQAELAKVKAALNNAKGVSNVRQTEDFSNFIFTFECDFANVTALNKAINIVVESLNTSSMPTIKMDNFSFASNRFNRLMKYPLELPNYEELPTIYQFMMETATFTGIYRFDKPVKNVSNKAAAISPSGKAVRYQSNFSSLLKKENSLATEISF